MNKIINNLEKNIEYIKILTDWISKKKIRSEQEKIALSFLIETIEACKSCLVLAENDLFYGVDSIARSLFERNIYLEKIMKNRNNAKAYNLKKILNNISLISSIESNNEDGKAYCKLFDLDNIALLKIIKIKFPNLVSTEYREKIFADYKSCFNYNIKSKDIMKMKWYNTTGRLGNLRILSYDMEIGYYYSILYNLLSKETHALNHNDLVKNSHSTTITIFEGSSELSNLSFITVILFSSNIIHIFEKKMKTPKYITKMFFEERMLIDYKPYFT